LRSSLVSIAGLTLFNDGDKVHFEKVVDDLLDYHRKVFLESGDSPDVPLLLSRTLQQYISFGADPAYVWKKYGNMLLKILDSYSGVKRDEAVIRSNGLLWTCRKGVALSWMNVYDGGCPVTERGGYQVETNALWYNALKFATAMDKKFGKGNAVKKWKKTIKSIEDNYFNYFWMEDCGYLADYVDENGKNRLTRPNQLIACCLDYTPLNDETRMEVVRSVKRHLLTAKGIRTLSPEDPGYKSVYEGNQHDRDMAHHNGCAYPWLLGDYIELNLKFIGAPFIKKGLALTNAFEEDINIHGIGSVAEIYDGDPFHKPHGCISCALSVAEIIRSRYLLNHFNKE
jgi:glycogen debranching enzyme